MGCLIPPSPLYFIHFSGDTLVIVVKYSEKDVEKTTISLNNTATLAEIGLKVLHMTDLYRNVLKRRKNHIVSTSNDMYRFLVALDYAWVINPRAAIMNRSDYCNDMCIENDFPNIILADEIDTAAERNIIEEMTPNLNIYAAQVDMKHEHISIPAVPITGPSTRILFVKRILELLVTPSNEGRRKNVVRS